MEENPFSKLIRSKTQMDVETQKRLADLLEPYIWIDPENDLVAFKDSSSDITTIKRVFISILARKVMNLINPNYPPTISASAIEMNTGLPGGTVRPKLGELYKKRLVVRDKGVYEVAPNAQINEIEQILLT